MRAGMSITLVLALALVNPALTPGAVRPLSTAQVCAITWGKDVRHVSVALRTRVFVAYGIPVADRAGMIIDHLVPRELAGADAFANLWPEQEAASHVKDRTENALHRAVCAATPTITLAAAQAQMRAWRTE